MENTYTSEELFHFVGHTTPNDDENNYKNLGLILKSRCISHYPHDGSWGTASYLANFDNSLETEELIVPSITCYADIPSNSLSIHVNKYGKFGLGLPRNLLIQFGARPVTYIPMRSDDWRSNHGLTLLRDIEATVKGFNQHIVKKNTVQQSKPRSLGKIPDTTQETITCLESMIYKDFLAFIKPFNSELADDDPNNFYMEREWRKYGNMKFEPVNLTKIFVAKGYKERVETDYPEYKNTVIEI